MHTKLRALGLAAGVAALALGGSPALAGDGHGGGHGGGHGDGHGSGHDYRLRTVVDGLDGPRGVDALGHGMTVVTESDGSFSLVVERKRRAPRVVELGSVAGGFAPAVAVGPHRTVFILTGAGGEPGGPPAPGSQTLYRWQPGDETPTVVTHIGEYQATDPDPDDLEELPEDSNPYGLAALRDGSVLVADAAGNDLLRVYKDGDTETVARLRPRTVEVPEGLPSDPANPLPPAGTPIPSEAVPTSVTVGADGYWYVGELRGFPATPGTSQIWRIKPGSVGAVCDPATPAVGACQRYADGLTSIVDLASDHHGAIYALSLSKLGWLQMEMEVPGSEVGALYRIRGNGENRVVRELFAGKLMTPGGVDVTGHRVYVTAPLFGPGSLWAATLRLPRHHNHHHH